MNKVIQSKLFFVKTVLFSLVSVIGFSSAFANDLPSSAIISQQNKTVTINISNKHINVILDEIYKQTKISFILKETKDVSELSKLSINVKSVPVFEALDRLLASTSFTYAVENNVVAIIKRPAVKTNISGLVKDGQGNPMPGVAVQVKNTAIGAVTDVDGVFKIIVNNPKDMLIFSFVGMKSQEMAWNGRKTLNIVMEEEVAQMDDVVITGMGQRKKEGYTGSAITVKGDDLKKFSTTNIAKALSAVDPGFRIMDDIVSGSNPNRLPDLRMRGQSTLPTGGGSGADDAIMMKGEYNTYPNQPLLIMDGFEIGLQVFSDLDPERVETITILKDAAATAIYGSKASNGVIVIETKAPAIGLLQVSYSGNVRIETPDLSGYNLLNAREKLQVEKIAGFYPEDKEIAYTKTYNGYLKEVERGVNTYWLSQPLRTAIQHRHALTFEGGDRALRYRLYVGLNNTPGVMKGSNRQALSGALDLSYRFKKILLRNSMTIDNSIGNNSPYGSFRDYSRLNPYLRPYGEDGDVLKNIQTTSVPMVTGNERIMNPMYNATFKNKDRSTNLGFRNLFKLEYMPIEALRLEAEFSLSKGVDKGEIFRPAQHTDFDKEKDPIKRGSYNIVQGESFQYSLDISAGYNKTFENKHYLSVYGRMSVQESSSSTYGAVATGFPNDNMDNILFGKQYNEKMTGGESTSRTIGWVGSFGYSYDYRYSVDFNIRLDGSSQFGKNNRFAPFWSAGARWNVLKESFMEGADFLSQFVFRASYGVTGTQGFPPYQSQQVYTYASLLQPYLASDGTGVELVGLGNPDLKWQRTDQLNVAMEMGILKNRITARLEYYQKITQNQLTDITLAPSIGFRSIPENMGTIQNKGIELSLSFIPYRNVAKGAVWSITLNGSHNTDKLTKISDALREMNDRNSDKNSDTKSSIPLPRYEEGQSLNRIWALKSMGIDPGSGLEIFMKRLTGDLTSLYDVVDLSPCGTMEPTVQGNINSSFSYKGFGVNVSFNYRFGGQTYNSTLVDKVENADLRYNADKRVLDLRWKNPGDVTQFKGLTNAVKGAGTPATSRFIMDENTLRCSSLSMSYRMDKENTKFMKKAFISSVAIGFTMEDMFYLSTVRMERGLDYPFARQFSLSLNLAF